MNDESQVPKLIPSGVQPDGSTSGKSSVTRNTSNSSSRSAGISVAPMGDVGTRAGAKPRPNDRIVFRPRTTAIASGMFIIVLMIWLATILGVSESGMIVVAITSCFLVGTTSVIHSMLRWENAESTYLKERSAAENWNQRFLKLQTESARTSSVLSHMTDGVLMLAPTTEIVLLNDAARHLLGVPEDGICLGQKLSALVRIPEIVQAVDRAKNEGVDQNVSVEIVEGSVVRPVAVRVSRILETTPPHLLLVLRDETEAQHVEAIRREFIANVSHELKTPLAAIKGYAETVELAIEDDPDAAKHFISQIDTQCKRLEDLIADMMRLARAQSGKGTMHVQAIDLKNVIEQAMTSFSPVASAKQIELIVKPNPDSTHVMAEEEAALAITQNLISNAIRHTEPGGHVTVTCRRENAGWIMAVQDDGVGIAQEFQDRIFERFYRVDRTRKTHDGGTGIGLSIVKNLTRALGGTVRVISSPGEGATFEVWLPAPEHAAP